MKRSKHSLSHYKLFTCDMGQLVPIGLYEVLPGDTVQQATSLLLRVSPLLAPVMHPVVVRIHHWFVPYRLLWSGWEQFITGGPDGISQEGNFPVITANASGFASGQLMDYMGVPPGVANIQVSAFPPRAYNKIFNENYRDEDLVTALNVPVTGGNDSLSPVTVQNVAWEKDTFTAARPWTQKGPAVTLPLGTSAPVIGTGSRSEWTSTGGGTGNLAVDANANVVLSGAGIGAGDVYLSGNSATSGMMADLAAATSVDVNDVREAFAIQRYQEARARYGDRYTEYLAYLGVRSSDARLQRPEYLGGGKQTISFTEVLQTGTDFDANTGVAQLKGHGIAASRSRRWRRFFEEHGIVMTLLSVRPRTMYANGIPRMWLRRTKEDFWQRELQHIGQQEVKLGEVWANAAVAGNTSVFGYQDRYSEYRHQWSQIAGDFRSTLNFWHLARIFAGQPALNASFVTCDPSTRIYASSATDSLWCMASHQVHARRLVDRGASSRIY